MERMRGGRVSKEKAWVLNQAVVSNSAKLDVMIITYIEYSAVSAYLHDYVITPELKKKHHCFANTDAFFIF